MNKDDIVAYGLPIVDTLPRPKKIVSVILEYTNTKMLKS